MRKIDRLSQYIEFKGLNDNRVTIECGLSQGLLGQARSGKSDLGAKTIEKILNTYQDLNKVWLLTGEGEMLKNSGVVQNNINGSNNYIGSSGTINNAPALPVYENNPCKHLKAPIVPLTLAVAKDVDVYEVVQNNPVQRSSVILDDVTVSLWYTLPDDALQPFYQKGDMFALLSYPPGEEVIIPGKIYVVDTYSNGMIARMLYGGENDSDYIARSFNLDKYPEFKIKRKDVIRIYKKILMVRR